METLRALHRREMGGSSHRTDDAYSLGYAPDQIRTIGQIEGTESLLMHNGCVNTANWNRDGNMLITGSDDRKLKIWDTSRYSNVTAKAVLHTGFVDNIFFADFIPGTQDRYVVACSADGSTRLFDLERPGYEDVLLSALGNAHGFLFWNESPAESPQAVVMFTANNDGTIARIDLRDPNKASTICGLEGDVPVKALAMPSSRTPGYLPYQIAVGGHARHIRVYDLRLNLPNNPLSSNQDCIQSFCPWSFERNWNDDRLMHELGVSGMMYSYDGRKLLVSYQGAQIYSFPTDAVPNDKGIIEESKVFGGHINYATFLKSVSYYGPKDEYVLSGSDSTHIWIWDERTTRVRLLLEADDNICNGVIPHPHDSSFCSYGIDSNAKLWKPGVVEGAPRCDDEYIDSILEGNVICLVKTRYLCLDVQSYLRNVRYLRSKPHDRGDTWPSYPRDLEIDALSNKETLLEAAEQIKGAGNDYFTDGMVKKALSKYEKAERYLLAYNFVKKYSRGPAELQNKLLHLEIMTYYILDEDSLFFRRDDEEQVTSLKVSRDSSTFTIRHTRKS
uniref:Uncharacterized protein n=1 Tax=Rhodosorus marinus TaxID=101924 RepID=A0A7S3A0U1_9RHOD|mmetsp:Transcript_37664/g.150191  ORF Transcript_37664/g.150191 Transcript_37664/m.150191 type:complete len:559 (+) Transcript_37664:662-2338(+)